MIDLRSLNPYEILDVDPRATVAEIKRAFQIAVKTYGPDHIATCGLFSEEQREEILNRIHEAYNILMDPERRTQWDEILKQKGQYPMEVEQPVRVPISEFSVQVAPRARSVVTQGSEDPAMRKEQENKIREVLSAAQQRGEWKGAILREIREIRGLTLEDIAQHTKISRGHLRSIEEDCYDFLPPDVYLKGFITQVAKVLGIDSTTIAGRIMEQVRSRRGPR